MKTDAEMEGPLCKPGNTELCKGTEAEGQTGNTLSSEPPQGPTPTDTLTVLRPTLKGQNVHRGPIAGNLHPFSKTVGIILPFIDL